MNHDELWTRVHAALDERRDPLDDPHILRCIEEAPEAFAAVERLTRRLPELVASPAQEPRAAGVLAAAALVVGLASAPLFFRDARPASGEAHASVADDVQPRLISYALTIRSEGPSGLHSTTNTNGSVVHEHEADIAPTPTIGQRSPVRGQHARITVHHQERIQP